MATALLAVQSDPDVSKMVSDCIAKGGKFYCKHVKLIDEKNVPAVQCGYIFYSGSE